MSRIGKKAIAVPKDVKVDIKERLVSVEGSKGKASRTLPDRLKIEHKDSQLFITSISNTKLDKTLHGLYRALILNMVIGVSEGYTRELEVIGVGYKVQAQGNMLNMQLGFSHPVNFPIPDGVKLETPKATLIVLRSIDKELIGKVARDIRQICPPEPYKGKGIRFSGEYIKKKVGKAQAGAK